MSTLATFLDIGKGAGTTLLYTVISFFFSFIIANAVAIHNTIYQNWISRLLKIYISIFRGTPVAVQLFTIYFTLPTLFPSFQISGFTSVIVTLSLNSGAYLSEIIRASLQSIDKGQFEAAKTLGISSWLMWKDIILKQMYRVALPNICNEFINLLKETAIVSMVTETDILKRATNIGAQTYSYTVPLLIAGFYYYVLIMLLTYISKRLEKSYDCC